MANQGEAKVNHLVILRGPLVPEINVATTDRGVRALTEKHECNLLAPKNSKQSKSDQEISSHGIVDPSGITVDLGKPLWINHIVFRLPDKDPPSYSYYVEVSKNLNDWRRVVDHSNYCCRSLQELYLEPTACRYIRVVGTKSPLHDSFSLVSFEAMFTEKPFCLKQGIVVPESNVASLEMGACVIEGVNQHGDSRDRQRMINGDWTDIDAFTRHKIGAGAVIVQLAQPYVIDSLHMLLWHWDSRKYSYYIETSTDMKEWTRIVDHSSRHCHSWQLFRFEARPIVFIKIVGTACTAPGTDGLWFDIAYLGCPIDDC